MPDFEEQFKQAVGAIPTIDFDYFNFEEQGFNYKIARDLAVLLIDKVDIDELKGLVTYEEDKTWSSSVGTGGTGWDMSSPTKSSQRACLASHFSNYARRQYSSCFLTLYEYQCLKELLEEIEESNYASHRQQIYDADIKLLKEVCSEFKKQYVRKNPEYLLTILSEEQ